MRAAVIQPGDYFKLCTCLYYRRIPATRTPERRVISVLKTRCVRSAPLMAQTIPYQR
ncbi:hypothetical protein EMIT053CA3_20409 [Pseudomonas donghuensis]